MSFAERIYHWLLRLYPAKHREDFEDEMLQHARDLNRDAEQLGKWNVARLCISLVKDGIVNGWKEHWEGIMATNRDIEPASWLTVFLAAIPGLLILVTHRMPAQLTPIPRTIWYLYLGVLVIGVSFIWWRERKIPVWALLPLGALVWSLIYWAGMGISGLVDSLNSLILVRAGIQVGIVALNVVVIAVILAAVLRGQRLPRSAWIWVGLMVAGNLLVAVLYSLEEFGSGGVLIGMVQYFTTAGVGPLEGLMLVCIGLLFAREHGVLAILVLVGGYSYMFADSDYLFGYPHHDWEWLATYFAVITILYLVVVPVALLRAKTSLGRALAVFVPLVIFHVLHFAMPLLVIQEPIRIMPGEVVWTINILFSFVLACVVYREMDTAGEKAAIESNLARDALGN